MPSYTVDTVIEAPRKIVYEIFADRERNGEFLPVIKTRLKTPGTTERQGVGAVHFLGVGPAGVSEQITELVPDELIRYKIVAGAPVKSHTGEIRFSDAAGGTRVVYSMEQIPKFPAPAAAIEFALKNLIGVFISGAKKEAARRTT